MPETGRLREGDGQRAGAVVGLDAVVGIHLREVGSGDLRAFGIDQGLRALEVVHDVGVLLVLQTRINFTLQGVFEIGSVHGRAVRALEAVADVEGHAQSIRCKLVRIGGARADVTLVIQRGQAFVAELEDFDFDTERRPLGVDHVGIDGAREAQHLDAGNRSGSRRGLNGRRSRRRGRSGRNGRRCRGRSRRRSSGRLNGCGCWRGGRGGRRTARHNRHQHA